MADTVVYVYAVTDADAPRPVVDSGVDGAGVRRVVAGRLAAVVSSVDAVRFGEEALKRSLEELPWLEATARAHHAVVDAAAQAGPVAPVRLATVYLDDDRVRGLLEDRAPAFAVVLDRIRGRVEWGVKAFATSSAAPAEPNPDPGAGPGASYLARRLAERNRAAHGQEEALAAAEAVHRELAGLVLASRRYPPQDPRLTGRSEDMVLNAPISWAPTTRRSGGSSRSDPRVPCGWSSPARGDDRAARALRPASRGPEHRPGPAGEPAARRTGSLIVPRSGSAPS